MTSTTRAHTRYRDKGGLIVPGVTTVLNLLAKPALIYWAWDLGMKGEDYRKVKEKAAGIGTVAHYLVECDIKGEEPDLGDFTPNIVRTAMVAFKAFTDWRETFPLTSIACEEEMVSEKNLYGGKLDWVARDPKGLIWLVDVKTSKAIYDEYLLQLAAYIYLWNEKHPDMLIDRSAIIRLDKVTGLPSWHPYGDLEHEFKMFMLLRDFYALQKSKDKNRDKGKAHRKSEIKYAAEQKGRRT